MLQVPRFGASEPRELHLAILDQSVFLVIRAAQFVMDERRTKGNRQRSSQYSELQYCKITFSIEKTEIGCRMIALSTDWQSLRFYDVIPTVSRVSASRSRDASINGRSARVLTWYPVYGADWSQDSDCSDRWKVEVFGVGRIFDSPIREKKVTYALKRRSSKSPSTRLS